MLMIYASDEVCKILYHRLMEDSLLTTMSMRPCLCTDHRSVSRASQLSGGASHPPGAERGATDMLITRVTVLKVCTMSGSATSWTVETWS